MANIGTTKGRRLGPALNRFAAMLIEEAHDLSGLSYAKLDEEFDLCAGECQRYLLYPRVSKTRSPKANEIQNLENLVARLLRRPAHIVLVEDNMRFNGSNDLLDVVVGGPDVGMNLRQADQVDLELAYEDDWPTYRRLKYSPQRNGVRLIDLYTWQYGILWDCGILPDPWTRKAQGIPADVPVESFLPALVEEAKQARLACQKLIQERSCLESLSAVLAAGNLPESTEDLELSAITTS
jgi:hypothetical protein